MNDLNRWTGIGHLGKDPEVKSFPNGDAYCNISIACNESWTDKTTNEKKGKAEWVNLVFTRKLAEIAGKYLKKGSKIYVEGKFRTRKWQDKDGADRYTSEIFVNSMQMLDGKNNSSAQSASMPEIPDDEIPF